MKRYTFLLSSVFIALCAYAINAGIMDMPLCPQEMSKWCWAACCEAVLKTYDVNNVSQSNIVTHIFGSVVNEGGGEYDMVKVLNDLGDCDASRVGKASEADLKMHADNNNPLIIGWVIPAQNHAVAYAGYNKHKGKSVYKIMNPSGSWMMMTYQAIETANNAGVWQASVITEKGIPKIKLTTLNNSGVFAQGEEVTISWEANFESTIDIELLKGGSSLNAITSSIPVTPSSYDWTIPKDLEDGRDYKIKISKIDQPTVFTESNFNFTLNTVPTFTSDSTGEAVVNVAWEHTVSVHDNCDPEKLEFSVSPDIPNGITLETNNDYTATLKGTPGEEGTFTFKIMVLDDILIDPVEQNFTLKVTDISAITFTNLIAEAHSPVFTSCPNPVQIGEQEISFSVNYPSIKSGEITIFDATGSLIDNMTLSQNGLYTWNLQNQQKNTVGSGTYLAILDIYDRNGACNSYRLYVAVKR